MPYSAADPGFFQIYRYDQLAELAMNPGLGRPLDGTVSYSAEIPALSGLFDGTEELVSVVSIPAFLLNKYWVWGKRGRAHMRREVLPFWLFTVAGERVVARLRKDLFRSIIAQEISFFDQSRTGELTNRLASDTTVLQNAVTVNVSMALRFGVSALGAMGLLVYTSPSLSGVALAVVPLVAISAALYGRLVRRLSKQVQDALAESTTVAEEALAGVRTVRAFAREDAEVERYGTSPTLADTPYWPLLLGLLLVLAVIAIPYLGGLVNWIIAIVGVGALWLLWRSNKVTAEKIA